MSPSKYYFSILLLHPLLPLLPPVNPLRPEIKRLVTGIVPSPKLLQWRTAEGEGFEACTIKLVQSSHRFGLAASSPNLSESSLACGL